MSYFRQAGIGLLVLGLLGCEKTEVVSPPAQKPVATPAAVEAPVVPPAIPQPVEETTPVVPDDSKAEARIRAQIPDKEALSKKLWDAAMAAGADSHVGTMYNEWDVNKHSCYILGVLLDRESVVRDLLASYETDTSMINVENAHDYQVMTISLDNFVANANRLLKLTRDERILEWNLDCVGQLDIPKSAFITQEGKSTFYVVKNEGRVLQVLGDIEQGFAQKVIDAIEANPKVQSVGLGSGGGYVYEALRAGAYIRSKGLETVLWNNCYSACPLVFMGGVQRENWSPYPTLGFHQVYAPDGEPAALDSQVYKDVYRYLVAMDIEPRYVIQKMWSAAPSDMAIVEPGDEAPCKANVFTWVQRGCTGPSYRPNRE